MTAQSHVGRRILSSVILSFPPMIYFLDTFFTVHRVKGNSMDQTICDGDIVLIRKVDFLPHYFKNKLTVRDLEDDENDNLEQDNDMRKSLRMDASVGKPAGDSLTLWRSPPMVLPGDVIAFTNPQAMESTEVKRAIGIGGQRIRPKYSYHKIEYLGAYNLWVESDNGIRGYNGSVSKKLMKGTVDRILWPPYRMIKVERVRPPLGRGWWP